MQNYTKQARIGFYCMSDLFVFNAYQIVLLVESHGVSAQFLSFKNSSKNSFTYFKKKVSCF